MAEEIGHPAHGNAARGSGQPSALNRWLLSLFGARFVLYLSDYIAMHLPYTQRYRELSLEHLVCRFCGHSVDLLGAWKCECGYKRPGNYFGRCREQKIETHIPLVKHFLASDNRLMEIPAIIKPISPSARSLESQP